MNSRGTPWRALAVIYCLHSFIRKDWIPTHPISVSLSVTIASSVVIVLLVLLEFNAFMSLDVQEELFVDTTRNHKLQVKIEFPN